MSNETHIHGRDCNFDCDDAMTHPTPTPMSDEELMAIKSRAHGDSSDVMLLVNELVAARAELADAKAMAASWSTSKDQLVEARAALLDARASLAAAEAELDRLRNTSRALLERARDFARAKLEYETRAQYERAAARLALDIDHLLNGTK